MEKFRRALHFDFHTMPGIDNLFGNFNAVDFAKKLVKSCEMLEQIMSEFENFKRSKTMRSLIIACNDVEEECDKLYLATVHNITKNSSDALTTLCWIRIFDCFEACADACEHVSECVGSIIMKNT